MKQFAQSLRDKMMDYGWAIASDDERTLSYPSTCLKREVSDNGYLIVEVSNICIEVRLCLSHQPTTSQSFDVELDEWEYNIDEEVDRLYPLIFSIYIFCKAMGEGS